MKQKRQLVKKYALQLGIGCLLLLFLYFYKQQTLWVEASYSRAFYPAFSFLHKILFSWIPFSVGDIFYILAVVVVIGLFGKMIQSIWRKNWNVLLLRFLQLISFCLALYLYFYASWGLNYYRVPLAKQLFLKTDTITLEQHVFVLDKFIARADEIRPQISFAEDRKAMDQELSLLMKDDQAFEGILSKTQVNVKKPLSSTIVSYFTVTGYFNPFTQEVQVNQKIPLVSYPFTVVHELSHQMGIGFEDECNFIAFYKLRTHANLQYQYAAYYEAINYLLRTLYLTNPKLFAQYKQKLSPLILKDFEEERLFWENYRGWVNTISGAFYDGYLKHNNQPEGMARYSLMSRLVIANELKNENQ
ncbi:DUF3810 domain-containing protein [Sphingobacterium hungaricum]